MGQRNPVWLIPVVIFPYIQVLKVENVDWTFQMLIPSIHWIQTWVITVPADGLAPHMFSSMFICLSRFKNTFHLPYDTIHNGQLDLTALQVLSHLPLDKMAANSADDICKCIFINEKFCILIRISLKFLPRGPIDNRPALVQVMAWRRTGDKLLPETTLTQFTDAYMWH